MKRIKVRYILFFSIFTFRILMALDFEIIPVKRKINILICLPLQQVEISRISSREENALVLTIFMNIYHPSHQISAFQYAHSLIYIVII